MSRLSRFKKAPALKLPKLSAKPTTSDDDDDDFIVRPFTSKSGKETSASNKSQDGKGKVVSSSSQSSSGGGTKSSAESSPSSSQAVSEYFVKEETNEVVGDNENDESSRPMENLKKKPASTKLIKEVKLEPMKVKDDDSENGVQVKETGEPCNTDSEAPGGGTNCPFCFKHLENKLTGTTHIKSCAKDLPTEQVIKVMELYERQLQEWQELGLPCPGLNAKKAEARQQNQGAKKGKKGAGGGRTRRKKQDEGGADPQLELALALSISLHEEVESRKEKETAFSGDAAGAYQMNEKKGRGDALEAQRKEIALTTSSSDKPVKVETESVVKRKPLVTSTAANENVPGVRRRNKKIQLSTLPLHTVDESRKKEIIGERVAAIIIDQSENIEDNNFYIRDCLLDKGVKIPKSLEQYRNKDLPLWKVAQAEKDEPDESFRVLETSKVMDLEIIEIPKKCLNHENEELSSDVKIKPDPSSMDKPKPKSVKTEVSSRKNEKKVVEQKKVLKTSSQPPRKSSDKCSPSHLSLENLDSLPPVVREIASLLYHKTSCDIILYGREEKRIRCHQFMLMARCPRLLKDAVVETKKGQDRKLIALTDYSHECVKAFVWFLYTGMILEGTSSELVSEIKELGEEYGVDIDVVEEVECGKDRDLQDVIQVEEDVKICSSPSPRKYELAFVEEDKEGQEIFEKSVELFSSFVEENHPPSPSPTDAHHKTHSSSTPPPDTDLDLNTNFSPIPSPPPVFEHPWHDLEVEKEDDCVSAASQDLFADVEEELLRRNSNQDFCNRTLTQDQVDQNDTLPTDVNNDVGFDYGISSGDLASQMQTQNSIATTTTTTAKKRSRSPSPSRWVSSEDGLFSATQIAEILDGAVIRETVKEPQKEDQDVVQAKKKQKIYDDDDDFDDGHDQTFMMMMDDFELGLRNNDHDDSVVEVVSVKETRKSVEQTRKSASQTFKNELNVVPKTHQNKSSLSSKISSDPSSLSPPGQSTPSSRPSKSLHKRLYRSGSTPNLSNYRCSNDTHRQSFRQMANLNFDDDPFEWDGDDSLFAKIRTPDLLGPNNKYSPIIVGSINNGVSSTPILREFNADRRISPRNLQLDQEEHDDDEIAPLSQKQGKGGRQKKSKSNQSSSKIKLPSKLPSSSSQPYYGFEPYGQPPPPQGASKPSRKQQPNKNISSQPQPNSNPSCISGSSNSAGSPMLNYSLIDTPILKAELKRYGLKPLPRSKAKVLLRHIYHETHK